MAQRNKLILLVHGFLIREVGSCLPYGTFVELGGLQPYRSDWA